MPLENPLPKQARSHLLVLRLAAAKKCQVGMKIIGSPLLRKMGNQKRTSANIWKVPN